MNTEQFDGHTPGPWTLEEMEDDEGQQWFEVPAVHYTTKQSGDGSQQEYADAQLIAAAPDLLAALIKEREEVKRLRKTIERAVRHLHPEDFNVASASESNGFLLEKMWAATCALEGKEDW